MYDGGEPGAPVDLLPAKPKKGKKRKMRAFRQQPLIYEINTWVWLAELSGTRATDQSILVPCRRRCGTLSRKAVSTPSG